MKDYSHRFIAREKKASKNLVVSIFLVLLLIFGSIFFGLPIMAKIIILLTSVDNNNSEVILKKEDIILFPPVLETLPEATNSSKISISGKADKGNKVQIFLNEKLLDEIDTDENGKFIYENINLNDGLNSINAKQLYQDKISEFSQIQKIQLIKSEPQLEISYPENEKKFYSEENTIEISGATDPENKIYINNKMVIVENDGNFSYSIKLNEGENKYTIKAIDIAGNNTEKELKLYYQK
jgi:hypothetical protein